MGAGVGAEGVSQKNVGLYGVSTSNHGVDGRSQQSYGVYGSSTSGLAGVAGFGPAGGHFGVYGFTAASPPAYGYAVLGYAPNGGFGVYGETTSGAAVVGGASTTGAGVVGVSSAGVGVSGYSTSAEAVSGMSNSNYGVQGSTTSGQAGVLGTTSSGTSSGVTGYNTSAGGGYGIIGSVNGGGIGVYGTAPSGYGVVGAVTGDSAVAGVYGSSSGYGVLGVSKSSAGAYGHSEFSSGVYGSSQTGDGVDAISVSGSGLSAKSTNGPAISATGYITATGGISAAAIDLRTNNGVVLNEEFPNENVLPLQFINTTTGYQVFRVDSAGDISYMGSLNGFNATRSGTTVETYAPQTASPTIEDSGTAELVNGVAAVRLDPTFAAAIDPHTSYRVFLTPDGDTNVLYVPQKTSAGFIVREAKGGRSTVTFDYRILAPELGKSGNRMREVALTSIHPRASALQRHQQQTPQLQLPPAPRAPRFSAPKVGRMTLPKPPPQSALPTR